MTTASSRDVYRDGAVHVNADKCDTCIFRPGNLMHLRPGRLKDMVDAVKEAGDSYIVCHETLPEWPSAHQAVCRGWWDGYRQDSGIMQLAERLGVVREVPAKLP